MFLRENGKTILEEDGYLGNNETIESAHLNVAKGLVDEEGLAAVYRENLIK